MFLSALTVAAFTGCSNDDSDDDGGIPSITVNGAQSTSVAVGLDGGTTEAVTIESSGDWTLTIAGKDGADVADCVAIPASGKKGTSTVTFKVEKAEKPRTYTATVTTVGSIAGQSIPLSVTITIEQTDAFVPTGEPLFYEDCGTSGGSDKPYVNEFQGWSRQGSISQEGVTYGNNGSNTSVRTGSGNYLPTDDEKSAVSGPNWIYIGYADQYFDIQNINVGSANNFTFTFTAQLQTAYSGGPTFETNLPSSIIKFSVSTDGLSYSEVPYTTKLIATGGSWNLCTAEFKLPAGVQTSTISVRLSDFAQQDGYQFRVDDFKLYEGGNGDDLPAPATPTTVSISEITEVGTAYEVEGATVVGTYQQGFVMQDETGAILAYMGYNAENIPAEGSVVTVSGKGAKYGDAMQLGSTKVISSASGTMPTLTPTVVTADNIAGMMKAPVATYVKMTGTLAISKSEDNTYYNVNFLFTGSGYTGTISYPNESLNVASFDGKIVDVEGWFVNNGSKDGNGKYFTVVARSIEENATAATGTLSSPTAFAATDPQPQVLNFTANEAAGTVKFEISGANVDKFTCSDQTASTVTVKAVGNNESDAAYTATLTMKSASGEDLASVNLSQSAPLPSGTATVTLTIDNIVSGKNGSIELGKSNYGLQDVTNESTWYTWITSSINFSGARITQGSGAEGAYNNSVLQIQGSKDGAAKQGFILNTTSLGEIVSIKVICQNSKETNTPGYHMYFGTEKNPSGNEMSCSSTVDGAGDLWSFTDTFDVSGKGYSYFKLYNNSNFSLYVKSIEITYKN